MSGYQKDDANFYRKGLKGRKNEIALIKTLLDGTTIVFQLIISVYPANLGQSFSALRHILLYPVPNIIPL